MLIKTDNSILCASETELELFELCRSAAIKRAYKFQFIQQTDR